MLTIFIYFIGEQPHRLYNIPFICPMSLFSVTSGQLLDLCTYIIQMIFNLILCLAPDFRYMAVCFSDFFHNFFIVRSNVAS